MKPKDGEAVYYNTGVFVVKSEMNAGVFRVEGKIAAAGTLYPSPCVERPDLIEAGRAAIWEKNVALINERTSLVYQLDVLLHELSSLQGKAGVTMGQLYLWKDATHQRQLTLDQQLKSFVSLKTKLQSAESDFIVTLDELDEQKEQS